MTKNYTGEPRVRRVCTMNTALVFTVGRGIFLSV